MEITLQNISFSFEKTPIIQELSARLIPGNFYDILGPNGSGKTTLLDMISGFMAPDKGKILLDTRDISSLSKKKIAQKISLVSQNYHINFPFSVGEVVMMGRHPFIDRFSQPCPRDVDLVSQVMDMTGISHLKHRRITELSSGEKQRCLFARALGQTLCAQLPGSSLFVSESLVKGSSTEAGAGSGPKTGIVCTWKPLNVPRETLVLRPRGPGPYVRPCHPGSGRG